MIKQLIKIVFLAFVIVLALIANVKVKADDCPLLDKPQPHPATERVEIPAEFLIEPAPEPEPEKVTSIFAPGVTAETITIDGVELDLLGEWKITEYCPCLICNGGYTGTASGNPMTPGRTVACNSLPLGAEIYVEGYGWRVVEDRGGGGAQWIDVLVADHEDAQSVEGSSRRKVWVRR